MISCPACESSGELQARRLVCVISQLCSHVLHLMEAQIKTSSSREEAGNPHIEQLIEAAEQIHLGKCVLPMSFAGF